MFKLIGREKMTFLRPKKILVYFSGHCFEKTDETGWVFILIFIQQKTNGGTFFLETPNYTFKSVLVRLFPWILFKSDHKT